MSETTWLLLLLETASRARDGHLTVDAVHVEGKVVSTRSEELL
jgi:hypothetical protein